jgi:DNA polymerase-3 subunit epsilon
MSNKLEFAIVDIETTGFSPKHYDKIVEVGIVRVDAMFNVISEYATLINPQRDVGATHIHGIRAEDVCDAPLYADVVGDIHQSLQGAVVVAHNAPFDLRFLTHHSQACGCPWPKVPTLCTMKLAKRLALGTTNSKLGTLCDFFKIPTGQAHTALDDARATTILLRHLLCALGGPISLDDLGIRYTEGETTRWSKTTPTGEEYRRDTARERHRQTFQDNLNRLTAPLPIHNDTNNPHDDYLALLALALEDRAFQPKEIAALTRVAAALDMDQEELREAHEVFFRDAIRDAWADETITSAERADIEKLALLLGIAGQFIEGMIQQERDNLTPQRPAAILGASNELTGKSVCFTGEFQTQIDGERVTRESLSEIAVQHGMVVRKGVTRSLDMLVCADADTMSSKGKKAKEYGIRILAETAFFKMLAV